MIDRLRHAQWGSLVLYIGIAVVGVYLPLLAGYEVVQYILDAGIEEPEELTYLFGWMAGAVSILAMWHLSRNERVVELLWPADVYLQTVHWPVGSEEGDRR